MVRDRREAITSGAQVEVFGERFNPTALQLTGMHQFVDHRFDRGGGEPEILADAVQAGHPQRVYGGEHQASQ